MLLFLIIFLLVTGLFHLYSYRRFIRRCHICKDHKKYFAFLLTLNYLGILTYGLSRALPLPTIFFYLGSLAIGLMFIFLFSTLIFELLTLLQKTIPLDPKRRLFFKKSTDYSIFALAAGYLGEGITNNLQEPIVRNIRLDQKILAKSVRIVQISDLHITQAMDPFFVETIVARINTLHPDIIAITGDLADAKISDIDASLRWLGKLKAKEGTYFVTGNHEFYGDVHAITALLEGMGITLMDNRSLYLKGLGINIVGFPDFEAKRFGGYESMDVAKATQGIDRKQPTLLLAHQPRAIKELEDFKPHLTLSGHTHGGQLFPFNYLVRLQQPYVKDLHQFDEKSFIYISSGTGFWGPPMRLGTSSEISCIDWS